jgi:hypothetical protein
MKKASQKTVTQKTIHEFVKFVLENYSDLIAIKNALMNQREV